MKHEIPRYRAASFNNNLDQWDRLCQTSIQRLTKADRDYNTHKTHHLAHCNGCAISSGRYTADG